MDEDEILYILAKRLEKKRGIRLTDVYDILGSCGLDMGESKFFIKKHVNGGRFVIDNWILKEINGKDGIITKYENENSKQNYLG